MLVADLCSPVYYHFSFEHSKLPYRDTKLNHVTEKTGNAQSKSRFRHLSNFSFLLKEWNGDRSVLKISFPCILFSTGNFQEYCINILKRILRNNKLQIRRKLKSAYVVTFPKSFSFSVVNPICPILSCDNGSLSHTSWKRRDKCWRMMWFFLVSWYFSSRLICPSTNLVYLIDINL